MSRAARSLLLTIIFAAGTLAGCAAIGAASAFALETHVLSGSIGARGTGNGQFEDPVAVAVNDAAASLTEPAAGDVYVADHGNKRVERFGPAGEYLGQFNGTGEYEVEGKVEHGTEAGFGSKSGEVETGQFTPATSSALAVDSSGALGDPSAGDVYVLDYEHDVIDKFSATGEYAGQLTGTCEATEACPGSEIPFYHPFAVATNSVGDLWVAEGEDEDVYEEKVGRTEYPEPTFVSEFGDTGSFIKRIPIYKPEGSNIEVGRVLGALAVDSEGSLYELSNEGPLKVNLSTGLVEYNFDSLNGIRGQNSRLGTEGTNKIELPDGYRGHSGGLGIAFSPSTGRLLFAESSEGGTVSEYGIGHELSSRPSSTFGKEDFAGGWRSQLQGIAVSAAGTVYVTEPETGSVLYFDPAVLPNVTSEAASQIAETTATLNGTTNPSGVAVTSCEFEYVTAAVDKASGFKNAADAPCASTPAGIEPVPVSANLSGLTAETEYDFRLRVENEQGASTGGVQSFKTLAPLVVSNEAFDDVASESATLAAEVDPGGRQVSYRFEYGATEGYGSATPSSELSPSYTATPVHVQVNGLQPETLYHFRIVVSEAAVGVQAGADTTFSTFPKDLFGLPDGRGYEMVSSLEDEEANANLLAGWPEFGEGAQYEGLDRAAANGDEVMYLSAPTTGGTGNEGNAILATRAPGGGWTQQNLQPDNAPGARFAAVSEGLAGGVVSSNTPLVPGLPESEAEHRFYVWQAGAGGYRLLPGRFLEEAAQGGAQLVELGEPEHEQLYEIREGVSSPVGVLPDGQLAETSELPAAHGASSSDGSRVVWESEGVLYLRDMETGESVQLEAEAGGKPRGLWGASADDSQVYFTNTEALTSGSKAERGKPDLYECAIAQVAGRLSCQLSDLTEEPQGEHADVRGVLGVSPDGEYVYYVAAGVLASGASEQECSTFEATLCNLYLYHDGETRFVATLSSQAYEDRSDWEQLEAEEPRLGETSQVSANGSLVFMSNQPLTGYDNEGDACVEPSVQKPEPGPCEEIYVYDPSGAGSLACASCRQSGEPPSGSRGEGSFLPSDVGVNDPAQNAAARPMRWISEDGARVFFDSGERLVPQDENGEEDVYEWERDGSGSCERNPGCVYLLSSGSGASSSYLLEASANGDDVFIVSRDTLVELGQAKDYDVYDARVGGGSQAIAAPSCSGTGCRGLPAAPPTFATPPSVTFSGIGNFPAPAKTKPVSKHKAKKKAKRCASGRVKKGRCVKAPSAKKAKKRRKARSHERSAKGRK